MITSVIEALTEKVSNQFNKGADPSAIKAIITSALGRLDMVSREEFDAQSAVLQRTREKVNALEIQLQQLEQHYLSAE